MLKPQKCVTFSLKNGCLDNRHFSLNGAELSNLKNDPFRFLGTMVFDTYQARNASDLIQEKLRGLLEKVDSAKIRGAYKAKIYGAYVTQCLRFYLTVHDISDAVSRQ